MPGTGEYTCVLRPAPMDPKQPIGGRVRLTSQIYKRVTNHLWQQIMDRNHIPYTHNSTVSLLICFSGWAHDPSLCPHLYLWPCVMAVVVAETVGIGPGEGHGCSWAFPALLGGVLTTGKPHERTNSALEKRFQPSSTREYSM